MINQIHSNLKIKSANYECEQRTNNARTTRGCTREQRARTRMNNARTTSANSPANYYATRPSGVLPPPEKEKPKNREMKAQGLPMDMGYHLKRCASDLALLRMPYLRRTFKRKVLNNEPFWWPAVSRHFVGV